MEDVARVGRVKGVGEGGYGKRQSDAIRAQGVGKVVTTFGVPSLTSMSSPSTVTVTVGRQSASVFDGRATCRDCGQPL